MPIFSLVEKFRSLFKKGYCEEDIVEAFASALEVNLCEDDEVGLYRVEQLKKLCNAWTQQNQKAGDDLMRDINECE